MTGEPAIPLTGSCNCGAISYEITEPLVGAALCYCKRCQRRTGTAYSATALTAQGSLRITKGEDHLAKWSAGDGWSKHFCPTCGSHILTTNPDDESLIAIRMGTLDSDPGIRPMAHQFVDYVAPWHTIPDDGLPRFGERIGTATQRPI